MSVESCQKWAVFHWLTCLCLALLLNVACAGAIGLFDFIELSFMSCDPIKFIKFNRINKDYRGFFLSMPLRKCSVISCKSSLFKSNSCACAHSTNLTPWNINTISKSITADDVPPIPSAFDNVVAVTVRTTDFTWPAQLTYRFVTLFFDRLRVFRVFGICADSVNRDSKPDKYRVA